MNWSSIKNVKKMFITECEREVVRARTHNKKSIVCTRNLYFKYIFT